MINKTKFEEICTKNNMYPVPEYDFLIISRSGDLKSVDSITGELNIIKPIGFNKNGIPKYHLENYKKESIIITLDRLLLNTFIGIFDSNIVYITDEGDYSLENIMYEINDIQRINNDILSINNIIFKKIYINNTKNIGTLSLIHI